MSSIAKDGLNDQPQQQQQQQEAKEERKQEEGEASGIDDKGKQAMAVSPSTSPAYSTSFGTDNATDDDTYDDVNPSLAKKRKVGPPPLVIEYWTESTDTKLSETLKAKAEQMKLQLEISIPGIDVKINPEFPMKDFNGLFRVRTETPIILVNYGDQKNPSTDDLLPLVTYEVMLKVRQLYDDGLI